MSKEYFAVDLKKDIGEEVLTTVCEYENCAFLDIITGIDVSNIDGYFRIKTRKLSKRSVNYWLKKLTTEDIKKYKDNIIDAKYSTVRNNKRAKSNIALHSYR